MASYMSADAQPREIIQVRDAVRFDADGATLSIEPIDDGPSGASLGLHLAEPDAPGRFNVEAAQRLGLEPGPAFARLQMGETVDGVRPEQVLGPVRPAGSWRFSASVARPIGRLSRRAGSGFCS